MRLEAASLHPPRGLADLIADLGTGQNGFGGTPIGSPVFARDGQSPLHQSHRERRAGGR